MPRSQPTESPAPVRRLPPLLRRAWYGLNQAFRRRLTLLTLRVELALAVVGAAILIWEGLFLIIVGAVAALALVVVLDNVHELRWGSASEPELALTSADSAGDRG